MEFKKVKNLFNFLSRLYIIYIVILVMAIVGGIYEYYSFKNIPSNYDPNNDLLPAEYITMTIGLIQTVILLLIFINFFRLIYRVSYNLQYQYNKKLEFTPGWTIGYFFIPILNLFKPYQAVKEIWKVSNNHIPIEANLLNFWWALWIISIIIGRFIIKYTIKNWGVSNNPDTTIIYLISDFFDIFLYLTEFNLVQKISKSYIQNYENLNPDLS